jgi:uncharacterized damage-inducible protein DinB
MLVARRRDTRRDTQGSAVDLPRELFRYHAWATVTLIDHCARLPPEQLRRAVPGTHGSILATLVHLVAADGRLLRLMTGEQDPSPLREGMEPPLAELRGRFAAQAPRWEDLAGRAGELDVTLPARRGNPPVPHAENLVLLQAIHHGNDHRTQVCTTLGALGLAVPEIDGWAYWRATRR